MARPRRELRQTTDIWPGFVDALSTLLLVIIFLLVVFVITGAALFGGLAYTLRWFQASGKEPEGTADGHHAPEPAHAAIALDTLSGR